MATTRPRKVTALKEAMTKTQLVASLSESTGLPKKDVAAVLNELGLVIERHIKKRAVGTFTLPGLLRIRRVRKPARKAQTMISPRTGEEIEVSAKPASAGVKVQPLMGLKQIVEYPDCGHTKLILLEPDGGDDHSTGNVCPYVKWQNCCHPGSRFHDRIPAMEGSHWNMLPHRAIILIPASRQLAFIIPLLPGPRRGDVDPWSRAAREARRSWAAQTVRRHGREPGAALSVPRVPHAAS